MPTPARHFLKAAEEYGQVDPNDEAAVARFYGAGLDGLDTDTLQDLFDELLAADGDAPEERLLPRSYPTGTAVPLAADHPIADRGTRTPPLLFPADSVAQRNSAVAAERVRAAVVRAILEHASPATVAPEIVHYLTTSGMAQSLARSLWSVRTIRLWAYVGGTLLLVASLRSIPDVLTLIHSLTSALQGIFR